jgi:SAM-dependent methyltransferase
MGPWPWLDKTPDDPMVELCFAIQEAGEEVLLRGLPVDTRPNKKSGHNNRRRKMRDYQHIERYLNTLAGDIYPQPSDPGHQAMLTNICEKWLPSLTNLNSILDVGCGQGQAFPTLKQHARRVEGITLGTDVNVCQSKGLKVKSADMSFLPYPDEDFDLIFARHVLEHSPAPLLSLMEWWRVSKQWLMLIMPDPKHYGYIGKNHYYVFVREQVDNILVQARWRPIWRDEEEKTELRIFCEKVRW